MSFIHKAIRAAYKAARSSSPGTYTIKLHSDGKLIHGLEIEDGFNGPRNPKVFAAEHQKGALGILLAPGGVSFRTAHGKPFFIKYTEFSFVFNHQPATEKPRPAPETAQGEAPMPKAA